MISHLSLCKRGHMSATVQKNLFFRNPYVIVNSLWVCWICNALIFGCLLIIECIWFLWNVFMKVSFLCSLSKVCWDRRLGWSSPLPLLHFTWDWHSEWTRQDYGDLGPGLCPQSGRSFLLQWCQGWRWHTL